MSVALRSTDLTAWQCRKEENKLSKKELIGCGLLVLSVFLAGCAKHEEAANANANASANTNAVATAPTTTTRPGPDNSEITTATDTNGVRTETRVFHNNPRVSKVVVTTRGDTRTVRVYSASGQEKEVAGNGSHDPLEATGDAIADTAGFVADKTKEGAKKGVEGTKKGVEVGKEVGEKTGQGAKKVAEKTVEGTKKVGNAIKDKIPH